MFKMLKPDAKIIKPLLKLGYPVVAANIGLVLMSLIDNAMVGVLGHIPLAASGISNTLYFVASVFGIGIMMVFSATIATWLKSKKRLASSMINATLFIGLIVSAFTSILLYILYENFQWFGQESSVDLEALPYFKILGYSIWPMFLHLAFKNISDGHSRTLPAMFSALSAVGLNIFLNWVLIYGNMGFPAYGLVGAGYATLICRWYMAVYMVIYILSHPDISYQWIDLKIRFSWKQVKQLLAVGIPSGLQFFYEVTAFAAAAIMSGWLGAKYLAAHQIAIGLSTFTYMIANGLSVASMIKVGESMASVKIKEIYKIGKNSVMLTSWIMFFFALIFVVFNHQLVAIFSYEAEVLKVASDILLIVAFFQIFDGIQAVSLGLLRGMGDTLIPSRIALFIYWIFALPVSYILGFHTPLHMNGIWLGLTIGLMLAAFFLFRRFRRLTFA
jgi:MATE family, multidrug efflux pump